METFYMTLDLYKFGVKARNNANLLGKSGQLVLLGLVPNTTKPFQNSYGGILRDLIHRKIPKTLNVLIINSFLHVT